jgi:hypothetical protein
MEDIGFIAHNIRLDDGTFTKGDERNSIDRLPSFTSARKILDVLFPENKEKYRLADLGCLEGGYAVEFARMGFQVLGVEIRDSNIAACHRVKSLTKLPNLEFVQDDAQNISRYGVFDAVFCCGLLYHLDRPKEFLETLSAVTRKALVLNTHFSTGERIVIPPGLLRKLYYKLRDRDDSICRFSLSGLAENENLPGRWYREFDSEDAFRNREASRKASWDNRRSFWIQREYLLQALSDVGFDIVLEQYDNLAPHIAENILHGSYRRDSRGVFIGIKSGDMAGG